MVGCLEAQVSKEDPTSAASCLIMPLMVGCCVFVSRTIEILWEEGKRGSGHMEDSKSCKYQGAERGEATRAHVEKNKLPNSDCGQSELDR